MNEPVTRTCQTVKKKTLKDGTVKEYVYTAKYNVRSGIVKCGKTELKKKITDCRDKAKLERIRLLMEELGM